jgi:heterotetrameric sarcosine oxidase gamma subunit
VAEALRITERSTLALASVMARKGVDAAALTERLGLAPPEGPQAARDDETTLIGVGPGAWLAIDERGRAGWAAGLGERLAGIASVTDQSSGYVIFRLSGEGAGALLQKGAFIDLDPVAFACGVAATTVIAHIGVIIWKVDDAPTFDVALFRSFAGSFRDWIALNAPGLSI